MIFVLKLKKTSQFNTEEQLLINRIDEAIKRNSPTGGSNPQPCDEPL